MTTTTTTTKQAKTINPEPYSPDRYLMAKKNFDFHNERLELQRLIENDWTEDTINDYVENITSDPDPETPHPVLTDYLKIIHSPDHDAILRERHRLKSIGYTEETLSRIIEKFHDLYADDPDVNNKPQKTVKIKPQPSLPKATNPATLLKYARVGNDYHKRVDKLDASGHTYEDLAFWLRRTIIDDNGIEFLKTIPKFDAFTNVADNMGDIEIPDNLYNLYKPIRIYPVEGPWPWTETLLRHVFDDQYELGLDYVQILFKNPEQILPILCLVSRANVTGKTTFLNWLRLIFGENIIVIGNQDIHGRFNTHYAYKLIIAVDESRIDKQAALEKLKALSTQRTIVYEGKFRDAYNVPFFGKFILCSNYEDNFINASDEDIRYWIRKLRKPENINYDIETDLEKEVPAFIDFILKRKLSTTKQSRMWFAPADLETEALKNVRQESKSWLYKDLKIFIKEFFLSNINTAQIYASATDIKKRWFEHNNKVEVNYIAKTLNNEFRLCSVLKSYMPFGEDPEVYKRAYLFRRVDFLTVEEFCDMPVTTGNDKDANDSTDKQTQNDGLPF